MLKFLDYADKIGLKIPANTSVRRWIHNHLAYENKINELWPKPEFYEIISLAQHHGLPTRALDWSYDFKVALYFAVKGILDENDEDCVLWAFNYKLVEYLFIFYFNSFKSINFVTWHFVEIIIQAFCFF